jgi:cytochrome c oxidase cbb3-type subunit III
VVDLLIWRGRSDPSLDIQLRDADTISGVRSRLTLFRVYAGCAALLLLYCSAAFSQGVKQAPQSESQALLATGESVFMQNCAFCHGRDAGGGETGPSLSASKLVSQDQNGEKISPVVRNGRPEKGMPRFNLSEQDLAGVVAFIHHQRAQANAHPGGRRGVAVGDLQTGNAELGKRYFNGAGGCASCHSATGDLAKVASKYQGLALERRLLYPEGAAATVTVTLPSGETLKGRLAYRDEFTLGMRDSEGWYHSWPISAVKFALSEPADAHVDLLAKYTDDDIHNLMAYLQTLR